jgi:hypothetical protein
MTRYAEEANELKEYESMLRVDPNQLDSALAEQAEVMWRIVKRLRIATNREAEAADDFKRAEGDAFASSKLDGRTDKESEHVSRNDPARKAAWIKWQAAKHDKAGWEGLLECWKARGFATQKLGDLYAAEYFTKDSYTPRGGRTSPAQYERPRIDRHDYSRDNTSNNAGPNMGSTSTSTRRERRPGSRG